MVDISSSYMKFQPVYHGSDTLSFMKKKKDFIGSVEYGTLLQMKTHPDCLCENWKKQEKWAIFSILVFKS